MSWGLCASGKSPDQCRWDSTSSGSPGRCRTRRPCRLRPECWNAREEHSFHRRPDRCSREAVEASPPCGSFAYRTCAASNRRKEICYLKELVLWYAGDSLDHLRRVARVVFLEQLENGARVLK